MCCSLFVPLILFERIRGRLDRPIPLRACAACCNHARVVNGLIAVSILDSLSMTAVSSSQETYDTIVGQTKITFLLQAIRDASAAEEVCTLATQALFYIEPIARLGFNVTLDRL